VDNYCEPAFVPIQMNWAQRPADLKLQREALQARLLVPQPAVTPSLAPAFFGKAGPRRIDAIP